MKRYAEGTRVPIDQSRIEIERLVRRYGAQEFASGWREQAASVQFRMKGRLVRFTVPMPKNDDREVRRRWRSVLLAVKSRLDVVASEIETFDEAFLAHIVTDRGTTVWEEVHAGKMLPPIGDRS